MNWYQGFALAVVILMVLSMVGYSFLTAPDTTPNEDTPPVDIDGPIDQPEIKTFYAEGIDANVVQLFPVMMITAGTEETEINLIDTVIYGVQGVSSVNSQYKSGGFEISTSGLVYVGNITFDPSFDKAEILEEIEAVAPLEIFEVVQTGLVKVPVEVRLQAEDDTDLFKDHHFDEPFLEAVLSFATLKDDQVEVSERIIFNGSQVMQSLAFETENKTAKPVSFTVRLNAVDLVELKKSFTFGAGTTYQGSIDFAWVEEKIESLGQVEEAVLEVQPIFYRITLAVDKNLSSQVLGDLNAGLSRMEGAKAVKFWHRPEADEVTIDFEPDTDYPALKTAIDSAFETSGLGYHDMVEPSVTFFGDFQATVTDSQQLNQDFFSLLESEGLENIELYQQAMVDLDTREFLGGTIVLTLDENEETINQALIFPGHQEGESLDVDVTVYGSRGTVSQLNAFEAK